MGNIESDLLEEAMTPADAEAGLALSAGAGWNQSADDWRFMLGEGRGIGVRDGEGRWIGSALALPLGGRLSWISMVLVAEEARRRGIGTRLLRRCIDAVGRQGRIAGLDATELGRPVYLPLGFRDVYAISRFRIAGPASAKPVAGSEVRPLTPADLRRVADFDAARSAMRRASVLAYLRQRAPELALVTEAGGRIRGYALGRPGRTAFQVGPVVADEEGIAVGLVGAALSRIAGPAILDMPDAHAGLRAWLDEAGAVRERGYMRMILGVPPAGLTDPTSVFALAGPELG